MARIRLLLSATCVALMLTVQVAAENATVETACFKGQPKVELFDDITVIENEGYVVGFSAETRTPIWACYRFDSSGTTHGAQPGGPGHRDLDREAAATRTKTRSSATANAHLTRLPRLVSGTSRRPTRRANTRPPPTLPRTPTTGKIS